MTELYPGKKLWLKRGETTLSKPEWWHVVAYGKPRKGQRYISGAIVEVYVALNDLDQEFWIVRRGI